MIKKALIQDHFFQNGGAEKCVTNILTADSSYDIFALTDFLDDYQRDTILMGKNVSTSFIQQLPFAKKYFRQYLALYPLAIENLNVSEYDIVLSSSYAVAKGVLTHSEQIHISYIHSPIRYAWDLYFQFLQENNLEKGLKAFIAKSILHYIRMWDVTTANRPDYLIANSEFIKDRIKKIYQRDAEVIYPPVDISQFSISTSSQDSYYITCSRLVPYKRIDQIVQAFNTMPDKKLLVVGEGPELIKLKKMASQNIEFLGFLSDDKYIHYLQQSKAFIFNALEDFGIAPVEAQACGIPVIAYGKGGVLESIKASFVDEGFITADSTGVFYRYQDVRDIRKAITFFEENENAFSKQTIRENSLRFSTEVFQEKMMNFINKVIEK